MHELGTGTTRRPTVTGLGGVGARFPQGISFAGKDTSRLSEYYGYLAVCYLSPTLIVNRKLAPSTRLVTRVYQEGVGTVVARVTALADS